MNPTQPTDPNLPPTPQPLDVVSSDVPPTTPPPPATPAESITVADPVVPLAFPMDQVGSPQPQLSSELPPAPDPVWDAPTDMTQAPPVSEPATPPQIPADWSQSPVTEDPVSAPVVDPALPPDAAPTDLSSLAAALGSPDNLGGSQPVAAAPQPTPPETPTVVTGSRGLHLPKWALIVGAITGLLAVLGASAYFILGIGQPTTDSTSLPATQQTLTSPPRASVPTPTVIPNLDSGTSLGSLSGASPSAQASSSGQIAPGATSVFDRRATQ
ncbi:hypothetical protein A3H85_01650 [Candidatus Daviesbacteria bacterium RIFCSPLOWO2_02_FULL_40_8]|nr:MAG: hypothetical protein A2780_01005 [Candidatus Daviesbacteria bacterium RIFCSPHIGHO2_01_FULL_41_45]OGE35148.1 MAG: hypothetical protein A3C32_02385 [Candidatus Daviesbacteria bacterium RIFCSPHIGHO2_02_FULL_41_14]OGE66812.1 MAG: hypothetical protein A3H85_01650 [Candidatus Daviesbacteria bacterium RIFCSPLOWO2_02_FULL_40_8]